MAERVCHCLVQLYILIVSKTDDFPVAAKKGPTTIVVGIGCSKSFERQVQLALAVRQRSSSTLCRAATPTTNIQFLSGNALLKAASFV
jgi:hypothetical protein